MKFIDVPDGSAVILHQFRRLSGRADEPTPRVVLMFVGYPEKHESGRRRFGVAYLKVDGDLEEFVQEVEYADAKSHYNHYCNEHIRLNMQRGYPGSHK